MERVGLLRRAGGRKLVAAMLTACCGTFVGVELQAQATTTPPAQTPAPPAPAQEKPDPWKFTTDAPVMMVFQIKSDKTADFESAWGSIRAAFGKVTKPEAKAFGDTMAKLYKVDVGGAAPGPVTIYVVQLDAPSKAFSYDPGKIIYETLIGEKALTAEEAKVIYQKLADSFTNANFWTLVKVG